MRRKKKKENITLPSLREVSPSLPRARKRATRWETIAYPGQDRGVTRWFLVAAATITPFVATIIMNQPRIFVLLSIFLLSLVMTYLFSREILYDKENKALKIVRTLEDDKYRHNLIKLSDTANSADWDALPASLRDDVRTVLVSGTVAAEWLEWVDQHPHHNPAGIETEKAQNWEVLNSASKTLNVLEKAISVAEVAQWEKHHPLSGAHLLTTAKNAAECAETCVEVFAEENSHTTP